MSKVRPQEEEQNPPTGAAEEVLHRQRRLLQNLLENIPIGVYVKDASAGFRYLLWNAWAERLTGVIRGEVVGRTDEDVFGCELADKFRQSDEEVVRTGKVLDVGQEPLLGVGRDRVIHTIKAPIRDDLGRITQILGLMEDVTVKKKLEEEVHHADKMRALGQLAGGMAHDLNNQLSAVLGYADLLQAEVEGDLAEEYLRWITTGSRRSIELVQQLLAFSRREKQISAPVDLHQVLAEVKSILERTSDKKVVMREEFHAPRAVILGDVSQIRNAVLNLALNARDALPSGGEILLRTEHLEISEEASPPGVSDLVPGEYVLLEVRDSGVGIPRELQSRIFEPFFTTRKSGSGLGLAAVYGTVKAHRGAIEVSSTPGKGSSFQVYFPLLGDALEVGTKVVPFDPEPGEGRGILVVDDEEGVRQLLLRILEGQGYPVFCAVNGLAALDVLAERPEEIGLVILDMNMPVMGGEETFFRLRAAYPSLRILILSGYSPGDAATRVLQAGAMGYIQKPISPGELLRWVTRRKQPGDS